MGACAKTFFNAGKIHFDNERWEAAVDAFSRCLDIVPLHVEAQHNRANALVRSGRLTEAVNAYLACLQQAPDFGAAYGSLATALRGLGVLDHARVMAQTALTLLPDSTDALICLGGLHFDLGEFQEAARVYSDALTLAPGHAGILNNLANTLHSLGQLDAALILHDRAYAVEPDNALYRYNRALALLAAGDFRRGWAEHEWRQRHPPYDPQTLVNRAAGPEWHGEDIAGRRILLHCEQGLGDTLQFVRYAPLVAARGARVVLEVQPALARLLRSLPGIETVVTIDEASPPTDLHCGLMSLPWIFGTALETIPATTPYLSASTNDLMAWRARLFADDMPDADEAILRVGLVWAGGAHRDDIAANLLDRRRSLPTDALAPLAGIDGVRFYSLQKERSALPAGLDMIDYMGTVRNFADTAALVMQLDLVIAVDTSVAHLAAALGKPVWLLSRFDGCWRWLHGRDDTPWYPTMRLFRQPVPGDWASVLDAVAHQLRRMTVERRMTEFSGSDLLRQPAVSGAA